VFELGLHLKFYFFVFPKKEEDFYAQKNLARNMRLCAFVELLAYEEELQDSHLLARKKIHSRQIF
jgi:hypothetical protein